MEHKFPPGKRDYFSGIPFFPEIFQWDEPKNHIPFTTQPEFPEFFGKWKTPNASPEKSCFVDGLVCFVSLCLRVFEFLNVTRRE